MIKNKGKILALLLMAGAAVTSFETPALADASKVVSIGNDLTQEERDLIMKYFGIAGDRSVQQIVVTNKDEISHLSSYIPIEQIGTRTVSCSYIKPTESGGIKVKTANLQYVTANMIASTLADLGIKNCEVVSACPFQVSGTGALTGIIMAYETATGETIDEAKKDIATQEVVITKDLAADIGTIEAEYVVNQVKAEAIQNNLTDSAQIQDAVVNIVNENNINITNEQVQNITNLTQNIVNENYGDTYINNVTEINQNIKQEIAASDDVDIQLKEEDIITPEPGTNDTTEQQQTESSILDGLDESIFGENVIASSTDDPALITQTTEQTETEMPGSFENTGDILFEQDTESEQKAETELTTEVETDVLVTEEHTEDITEKTSDVTEWTTELMTKPDTEQVTEQTTEPWTNEIPEGTTEETSESETSEEETTESSNLTTADGKTAEDMEIPEDHVSIFGYNLDIFMEKGGEKAAKEFLFVEQYLSEQIPFDTNDGNDAAANDEDEDCFTIYNTNESRKDTGKYISAVEKYMLDLYYRHYMDGMTGDGCGYQNISGVEDLSTLYTDFITQADELYNYSQLTEEELNAIKKAAPGKDMENSSAEETSGVETELDLEM